jgi:hypothetical protein
MWHDGLVFPRCNCYKNRFIRARRGHVLRHLAPWSRHHISGTITSVHDVNKWRAPWFVFHTNPQRKYLNQLFLLLRHFNNGTSWKESVVIWRANFAPSWHRPTVNWLNNKEHSTKHVDEHILCYFYPLKQNVSNIAKMVYLSIFLLSATNQLTKFLIGFCGI